MPELPDIETLRRGLAPRLRDRTIARVQVLNPNLRTRLRPAVLRRRLHGRRIVRVGRRAKYLLLELGDAQVLVVHLGMSGRFLLLPASAPLAPHTHVRLGLDDGQELRFVDPRRFGMFFVVSGAAVQTHRRFVGLGPEPLEADFTPAYLQWRARGVRRPVKNFLMDAAVVVGVGNIYACEALHRAQVHPATPAARLRLPRWQRVHAAVRDTLEAALGQGGTTIADFRAADGSVGGFQVHLAVYGRAGDACGRCGRRIRRSVQAGRSTY